MGFTQLRAEGGVVQPTCTMTLGYRKRTKTNFDWTVSLFTSKYINHELNTLIGQFERTKV